MVVSEPIIILELDVVLPETIGDFNIMTSIALQQSKEDWVGLLELLVVKHYEDLVANDQNDQQC